MIAAADSASFGSPAVLSAARGPLGVAVAEDPAVRVLFTARGDSPGGEPANLSYRVGTEDADAVGAARARALGLIGATADRAVFMEQVHGAGVAEVDHGDAGRGASDPDDAIPGVDALVTGATDVALAVLVADCVPIVLVDPGRGVAAVHAGRTGLERGVVGEAVRRLAPQRPQSVVAIMGPAIGGCCYEVERDMADAIARRWPQARGTTTWGTPSVDLPAVARAQLAEAAVGRVEAVGSCTRCDATRWFSHRAAARGAAAGRQAGLVMRSSTVERDAAPARAVTAPSLQSV